MLVAINCLLHHFGNHSSCIIIYTIKASQKTPYCNSSPRQFESSLESRLFCNRIEFTVYTVCIAPAVQNIAQTDQTIHERSDSVLLASSA